MKKLVILDLLKESSSEGFQAILRISEEGTRTNANNIVCQTVGFLHPLPENLQSALSQWRSIYPELKDRRGNSASSLRSSSRSRWANDYSPQQPDELEKELNTWLDGSDRSWESIKSRLANNGSDNPSEEIVVLIETEDINLQRLPWQEWDLLRKFYPDAEIALSAPVKASPYPPPRCSEIRILAVVGKSNGIDTSSDLKVIKKLKKKGADVTTLRQPSPKEFYSALREDKGYHIFIYIGHSWSDESDTNGGIDVNQTDSFRITDCDDAMKRAIGNGLQLAIFNSCDGLGLAKKLAEYNLPQCIFMREAVPDPVAKKFLKYFFKEFTAGKSLFASVREARIRLEHWNLKYPGAQWLPTICIGSSATAHTWESMRAGDRPSDLRTTKQTGPNKSPIAVALVAVLVGLVAGSAITISAIAIFNKYINSPANTTGGRDIHKSELTDKESKICAYILDGKREWKG